MATQQESDVLASRIDKAMLTPFIRRLLHSEIATVVDWCSHQIHGGAGGGNLYRLTGNAKDGGNQVPWLLILKILRSGERNSHPSHTGYWKREPLAYQSGVLDNLPGALAAPRCLGVIEPEENEIWMWLEEIIDESGKKWSLENYGRAARHFGQFNGSYLTGTAIPSLPWVSRNWLRGWVSGAPTEAFNLLRRSLDHPLVARLFPNDNLQRLLQVQDEWEMFFKAIERLPQTFCHLDAFRRNLFASYSPEGDARTVAIDWAFTGQGAVGEEIAPLVAASLFFFEVDMSDDHELDQVVFQSYLDGLSDAGWHDDPRMVRLGYVVATTLRYTVPFSLSFLIDESRHAGLEQFFGRSIEEMMVCWSKLTVFQLDLADEAKVLLNVVR